MPTNSLPENLHSDFETKLKKIIQIFEEDKTLFFTVGYLILNVIGVTFSGVYFYYFNINILEYSQISDFVVIAFKDPFYIIFFLLTVFIIFLLYLWDKWILKKFPKFWLFFKKKRFFIKQNANTLLVSYILVLLLYTIEAAMFYGERKAKTIKEGHGVRVKVHLTTGAEPTLKDSLPTFIGTTSNFLFVYDHQKKATEIIPFNSIRKLTFQDKNTANVIAKTSPTPAQKSR